MAQIIRVVEDGVEFFSIESTGESGMSQSGLAKLCGVPTYTITALLNQCDTGNAPTKSLKILSNGMWRLVNDLDIVGDEAIAEILDYFAFIQFNDLALMNLTNLWRNSENLFTLEEAHNRIAKIEIKMFKPKNKNLSQKVSNNPRNREQVIQIRLKDELCGQTEVHTRAGRIDLLTSTEVIEIKDAADWKNGVGQLLAYQVYYPIHKKRLHLFGYCGNLSDIKFVCSSLDIEVTTELDIKVKPEID